MQPDGTCTQYKPLGRPIFSKIEFILKENIISNEFVDIADILDPSSDLEPFDFHLSVKHNGAPFWKKEKVFDSRALMKLEVHLLRLEMSRPYLP